MQVTHLAVLAIAVLALAADCYGANIVAIGFKNASHLFELDGVLKPLAERGHQVYVLLDELHTIPKNLHPSYKRVTYRVKLGYLGDPLDSESQQNFITGIQKGTVDDSYIFETVKAVCTDMMSDETLFPRLEALNLDIAVVDNFIAPCYFLVPYKLGIPFVVLGTPVVTWPLRLPVLPSVIPPKFILGGIAIDFCAGSEATPGFKKRFCRLLSHASIEYIESRLETEYLRKYIDFPSITAVRENASLNLVNHHILLSTALPKLPHVEYVGGITTKPAKALPAELQAWMDASDKVVVVSFGSRFGSLPTDIAEKMLDAFGRCKSKSYRFLFRLNRSAYKGKVEVGENVRLMDWLPQNDALGHKHTRLFVTHSGNNGQFEAVYHGVPMLCFYIHTDQISNAQRVVDRGYGLMMNIFNFSAQELASSLELIIDRNSSFAHRIKKASEIFHSEKHPSERAADAVEHVLKYGSEHLRPTEAYKLEWWEFYMLDVLCVLYGSVLSVGVLGVLFVKCVFGCVYRRCCRQEKTKRD